MSTAGSLALVAAPVAVVRVSRFDAPACDAHEDGIALWRDSGATSIGFRSYGYWREFCAANRMDPLEATATVLERTPRTSSQRSPSRRARERPQQLVEGGSNPVSDRRE